MRTALHRPPLRPRHRTLGRRAIGTGTAALLLGAGLTLVPGTAQAADAPTITVSMTTGLDPDGATITVTGSGFDPAANVGTRPPLAGSPSGVYVVFGAVGDPWRPSAGGTSAARSIVDQAWLLPQAQYDQLGGSATPGLALLNPDGSFSVTLDAAKDPALTGSYGVFTYAAGGAVNADHELFTATAFAGDEPTPTATPTASPTASPTVSPSASPSASPTAAPVSQVTGGSLTWGVKEAFRTYLTSSIANGTVTTGQGASTGSNGAYVFPGATGTADLTQGAISAQYGGTVAFYGHSGALDLTFANPHVEVGHSGALLHVDVTVKGPGQPTTTLPDVPLAELALGQPAFAGGVLTWTDVPATLTEEGAEAFGGFYDEGEALDPVTIVAALDGAGTAPAPSATATPTATPTVAASFSDTSVAPGDQVTVAVPAGTFTAGETVTATAYSTPTALGTAVAAADGSLSFSFAVPSALASGQHSVVLVGQTSGVQASATFLVDAADDATLPVTGAGLGVLFGGTGLVLAGALLLLAARRRELQQA